MFLQQIPGQTSHQRTTFIFGVVGGDVREPCAAKCSGLGGTCALTDFRAFSNYLPFHHLVFNSHYILAHVVAQSLIGDITQHFKTISKHSMNNVLNKSRGESERSGGLNILPFNLINKLIFYRDQLSP